MTNENSFVCKKSFSSTADTGITFHWLKCAFAESSKDAVSNAVCIVHLPAALAAAAKSSDKEEVRAALEWSRRKFDRWMEIAQLRKFDRWMEIAQLRKSMRKSIPQRVLVDFELPLDDSNVGKALTWLSKNESRSLTQHVLDAVLLVYLPVALSALNDPSLELAILRANTIFSRRIDVPGYRCPIGEVNKPVVGPVVKPTIHLSPPQASSVEAQRPNTPPVESPLTEEDIADPSDSGNHSYMPELNEDEDF